MQAMATIAKRMRTSVLPRILAIAPGLNPSNVPASNADRKHAVPVAVSQLKSNLAFSGVGLATTGCARSTALCKYGTFHPPLRNAGVVALPIAVFMDGRPQQSTNSD